MTEGSDRMVQYDVKICDQDGNLYLMSRCRDVKDSCKLSKKRE